MFDSAAVGTSGKFFDFSPTTTLYNRPRNHTPDKKVSDVTNDLTNDFTSTFFLYIIILVKRLDNVKVYKKLPLKAPKTYL